MSVTNVLFVGLQKPIGMAIEEPTTVEQLKELMFPDQSDALYLCRGGCPLSDNDVITPSCDVLVLSAHFRLCGGKGGFGSLIRATGSRRNKNADKSACRDISGRRVRDIKDKKKMAEWVAAEKERKRERAERKKRRLKRMMEEPKHKFEDASYMESIKSTEEGMADSLKLGLQQDTASAAGPSSKRPKLWMHSEDLSSSEDEESSPVDSDDSDSSSTEETPTLSPADYTVNTPPPATTLSPANSPPPATTLSPANTPPQASASSQSPAIESQSKKPCEDVSTSSAQPLAPVYDDPPTTSRCSSYEEIDLTQYSSVEDLLTVGGEALKRTLSSRGLKCGGTPLERAKRLFSTKGLTSQQIPNNFWAKKKKK